MDALELLKTDHKKVKELFKRRKATKTRNSRSNSLSKSRRNSKLIRILRRRFSIRP